jgi:hypothetical protein
MPHPERNAKRHAAPHGGAGEASRERKKKGRTTRPEFREEAPHAGALR